MAKQTRIFLSGKIENLIFYEFRGIPCSRTAPLKVRQSKATKASAKLFGMAVSMSAALRQNLWTILPEKDPHKNMYLLNAGILKWLKEKRTKNPTPSNALSPLHGLSFNKDCLLYSRLHKAVTVDWSKSGQVVVRIPALTPAKDISAPGKTQMLVWRITVASCTVSSPSVVGERRIKELQMPYDNLPVGARSIELPFPLGRGDLAIVVISLQYWVAKNGQTSLLTNAKWAPVDIVDAAYW